MARSKTPERTGKNARGISDDDKTEGAENVDANRRQSSSKKRKHADASPNVKEAQKAEKKRAGWRLLIRIMIASWFFASALRLFNVEGKGQWDAWLSKQSRYVTYSEIYAVVF